MPDDGLFIKNVSVRILEDGTSRNQCVGDSLSRRFTRPQLDAGWVDTLLLR
jgi:hypothetical protein